MKDKIRINFPQIDGLIHYVADSTVLVGCRLCLHTTQDQSESFKVATESEIQELITIDISIRWSSDKHPICDRKTPKPRGGKKVQSSAVSPPPSSSSAPPPKVFIAPSLSSPAVRMSLTLPPDPKDRQKIAHKFASIQQFRVIPGLVSFTPSIRDPDIHQLAIVIYSTSPFRAKSFIDAHIESIRSELALNVPLDMIVREYREVEYVALPPEKRLSAVHFQKCFVPFQTSAALFTYHSNVSSVEIGYGWNTHSGDWDADPSLLVSVISKGFVPWGETSLPELIDGIPIHVQEGYYSPTSPEFNEVQPAGCYWADMPVHPGTSIGIQSSGGNTGSGTLGATLLSGDQPLILTNAHVLLGCTGTDNIIQPSMRDVKRSVSHPSNVLNEASDIKDFIVATIDRRVSGFETVTVPVQFPFVESGIAERKVQEAMQDEGSPTSFDYVVVSPQSRYPYPIPVGLDIGVGVWNGRRSIECLPKAPLPFLHRDVLFTVVVDPNWVTISELWSSDFDELSIFKVGRSTSFTFTKLRDSPAHIMACEFGEFHIPLPMSAVVPEAACMISCKWRYDCTVPDNPSCPCRSHLSTPLLNQILADSPFLRPFFLVGDSGSVCWLFTPNEQAGPSTIRPLGLLCGGLTNSRKSLAVLNPIEAAMVHLQNTYPDIRFAP